MSGETCDAADESHVLYCKTKNCQGPQMFSDVFSLIPEVMARNPVFKP